MENKIIIDNIKYGYNLEVFSVEFRPERIYSAIENFDYYVKPGMDTQIFMKEFETAFNQGKEMVTKMKYYSDMVSLPFSYEHSLWVMTAFSLVRLIKEFLNKDYFSSQIYRKVHEENNNQTALITFLNRYNIELLTLYKVIRNYPINSLHGITKRFIPLDSKNNPK